MYPLSGLAVPSMQFAFAVACLRWYALHPTLLLASARACLTLQADRNQLAESVGQLEGRVEELQAAGTAGENALQEQLTASSAENAALCEQLTVAAAETEALREQLAEAQGDRGRLEAKVAKHKQVGQRYWRVCAGSGLSRSTFTDFASCT